MLTEQDKADIKKMIEESQRTPQDKELERKRIMQITDRVQRRKEIARFMEKNNGSWT